MELKKYIKKLSSVDREAFAKRCGTSFAFIRNIAYGYKRAGESLCINIERESGGSVTCEELRPDVDWAYLRSTVTTPKPHIRIPHIIPEADESMVTPSTEKMLIIDTSDRRDEERRNGDRRIKERRNDDRRSDDGVGRRVGERRVGDRRSCDRRE